MNGLTRIYNSNSKGNHNPFFSLRLANYGIHNSNSKGNHNEQEQYIKAMSGIYNSIF